MTALGRIAVRKATLEDRETMYRIHVDSVRMLCARHYSKYQIDRWFEGRSPNAYTGAIDWGGDWIASTEEEPVAFIEFFTKSISMLYVLSRFSGRGIGRFLMEHAQPRCRVIKAVSASRHRLHDLQHVEIAVCEEAGIVSEGKCKTTSEMQSMLGKLYTKLGSS